MMKSSRHDRSLTPALSQRERGSEETLRDVR